MGIDEVGAFNKRIHQFLDLVWKGTYHHCLFGEGCTGEVIDASFGFTSGAIRTTRWRPRNATCP